VDLIFWKGNGFLRRLSTVTHQQPIGPAIGIATLRMDGFAAWEAERIWRVTAVPLNGDRLFVNAEAQTFSAR
jgi:hypothetical protein